MSTFNVRKEIEYLYGRLATLHRLYCAHHDFGYSPSSIYSQGDSEGRIDEGYEDPTLASILDTRKKRSRGELRSTRRMLARIQEQVDAQIKSFELLDGEE